MKKKNYIFCFLYSIISVYLLTSNLTLYAQPTNETASAIWIVDTLVDELDGSCIDGDCSLRDAIDLAGVNSQIDINVSGMLTLTLGTILINRNVTIVGPGANNLIINGTNSSRIFRIPGSGEATIKHLQIINGRTVNSGGAISNLGTLTISHMIFNNNLAADGSDGGAINNLGNMIIDYSMFESNQSVSNWGGAIYNDANLTINNSTFVNNSATDGGGIYNDKSGTITMTNSTVSSNFIFDDGSGGGIYNDNIATIYHSTIAFNSAASGTGAGIFNKDEAGPLNLFHTIIAQNLNGLDCDLDGNALFLDLGYNNVEDGSCVTNPTSFSGNPNLAPLQDNGGENFTHALPLSSIALDAGDPAISGEPIWDQRGPLYPRITNGAIDIGAYEFQGEPYPRCFVEINGDNTTDFSSWNGSAIQAAVDIVAPNTLIKVAGICAGIDYRAALTQTVYLSKSLSLQGGYSQTDWLSLPNLLLNPTIIDGESEGRLVYIPPGINATIDRFILQNGYMRTGHGGSIYNDANLILTNSLITNSASIDQWSTGLAGWGGAILNNGTAHISNTTFLTGSATYRAGAIYNFNTLTVTNSSFAFHNAPFGGAIYNHFSGDLVVENSLFEFNNGGNGATLFNIGNSSLSHSTFRNNSASNSGGAITSNGTLTIQYSTLNNNNATIQGGALYHWDNNSTFLIEHTAIYSNSAESGGGIYNSSPLNNSLINSTISYNNASLAGSALQTSNGTINGSHLTINGNNDPTAALNNAVGATINLAHTIIGNSTSLDCRNLGVFNDNGFNMVEDNSCLTNSNSFAAPPNLAPLQNNGGPTWTQAPLPGSLALDSGDPTFTSPPDYDQRGDGFIRVGNGRIDIGAYEFCAPPIGAVTDLNITQSELTDITLSWSNTTDAEEFILYRAPLPYLPLTATYDQGFTDSDVAHDDSGVVGDPITNYYYTIAPYNDCLIIGTPSNQVAEFDFLIVPGS